MPAIIEVRNLVKKFGQMRAVDGISFEVEAGICVGLLGPNGAGKTTTVEMMEGIQSPTSGTILYKGQTLGADFKQQAGIMFQSTALQEFITVEETIRLFHRLYDKVIPLAELIEKCHLQDILKQDTKKLSGGQKQRVLLALALINQPGIVFMDEPTTGLDPQARRNVWRVVETIKAQGTSIILTTHYMEEAYQLCDQVIIIDHGKIIAQGTPNALLSAHFDDSVILLSKSAVGDHAEALNAVLMGDDVQIISKDVNQTIAQLLQFNIPLASLRIRERGLEDLFIELTGQDVRQ